MNHNYIGTEHILLGLIHEGEGVAAKALESLGISASSPCAAQVEEMIGQGGASPSGHIPVHPEGQEGARAERCARRLQLGHNYIGTEHILLGLIREGEGVAAQVLVKLGADLARVRRAGHPAAVRPTAGSPARTRATKPRAPPPAARQRRVGLGLARARPVRAQPHANSLSREGPRPGDRPGSGGRAGHADPVAPHQEQPGAGRRAGRGQDRHRGGSCPVHRLPTTCPRPAARPPALHAGPRRAGGRAAATGATSRSGSRRSSRRSAAAATSSCSSTRSTPSWARARLRAPSTRHRSSSPCWRAASCRPSAPPRSTSTASTLEKDAALERRFQKVSGGRAHVAHTIEILKGLRERYESAPPGHHHRPGAGGRGEPRRPLHLRPAPARQGHRPDRRGRVAPAHEAHVDAAASSRSSSPSCPR